MVTHLERDILEYEVRWALGSITTDKASGGDRIPAKLFKILKDDAVKVLHSICQQIWKTQQWPQDWKRSVFIPIPKKGSAKEYSNYQTIVLSSHASKVMLKSFKLGISSTWIKNFQMYNLGLEKAEEPEINQIANIHWIKEKAREFQKNIYFCFIDYTKALAMWITTNCGKFLKRWEYQTILPVSWETCIRVKK